MKTILKFAALASAVLLAPRSAQALPETGGLNRITGSLVTWQEPLRLQAQTGAVDVSVANYKGYSLSYERQKRVKGGGYGLIAGLGTGSASSGGTSSDVNYKQGGISWTSIQLQPRVIWALSDSIDLALGVAGSYRLAAWSETDQVKVTPLRQLNAVFFADFDCMLGEKLSFRQSFGIGSPDVGLYMRFGLAYDL